MGRVGFSNGLMLFERGRNKNSLKSKIFLVTPAGEEKITPSIPCSQRCEGQIRETSLAEEEDGQNLADDVAEAVRFRLREKRLLIDALNTLQRAASLTLTGGVRLDVVAGDGAAAESNAAKSPPGGFEVRKAKYEKEL